MPLIFVKSQARPAAEGCDRCGTLRYREGTLARCPLTECKLCGAVQCHSNGSARSLCGVCLIGLLPGWSGASGPCERAGCGSPRVAEARQRSLCRAHLERVVVRGTYGPKGPIVEIARGRLRAAIDGRTEGWKMYAVTAENLEETVRTASGPRRIEDGPSPGTLLAEVE